MSKKSKPFKKVPVRFHPKGLSVIYEDHDIIVVDKACNLLTVSTDKEKEKTAYYLLTDYVRKGNQKSKKRVFIVHRLDRDTSGVLIFAKKEYIKRNLQNDWKNFKKKYCAVVCGNMEKQTDTITSFLTENKNHKMYSTEDHTKGKLSKTRYRVVRESKYYSLLDIDLLTGRKNQIRVHMAESGHPVAGDRAYGEPQKRKVKRLCLHAASITIKHPETKEMMTFTAKVPGFFNSLIGDK